ncbi:MAG: tetratricopeptide repeat protein [Deltaproteobacteria bacterium]|nr:MAG: tetratricopeptide repeat protein [Deltaproteobacteria bacterium]
MNKKLLFLLLILLVLFFTGNAFSAVNENNTEKNGVPESGSTDTPVDKNRELAQEAFQEGYELFEEKEYKDACPLFYQYLSNSSPDDADYEWAQFFFGICLKKSGFSHAAVDALSELVTRKPNPKIVSYCLEFFENTIRTSPYDHDLVINKVICDQEYGFVEDELSDFIHYHQGVNDWKHGLVSWGDDHFNKIKPNTYYFYQFQYHQALMRIHSGQIDEAIAILKKIMESPLKDDPLRNEVRKTIARLLYEKGEYKEADKLYGEITKNILEQSQNLLERAWAHYRIGNPEKAMGFLYAFEAPSFQNYFTPEYYILKSFIFKDVCHYQSALQVVTDFKYRYGVALEDIYQRGNPEDNYPLMLVLMNKKKIHEIWKFLELLESEKTEIETIQDKPFREYLEKLYALQIEESAKDLRLTIQDEYEVMANQLLRYEEESHLMEYEIGMDMYQRIHESHYQDEKSVENPSKDGLVVYPFQGEFWNDELADYHVKLPNKCNNNEEWDVFFK